MDSINKTIYFNKKNSKKNSQTAMSVPLTKNNKTPTHSSEGILKESNDLTMNYRTELCKMYEINGNCRFGDNCMFAHGKKNLKQKLCSNFFEQGLCLYGNRCQFLHHYPKEKDKAVITFSYLKTLQKLSKGNISISLYDKYKHKSLNVLKSIIDYTAIDMSTCYFDDIILLQSQQNHNNIQ